MQKLKFEFCPVPVNILSRTDFTANEKLLYSLLLGYQANGDAWASNESLAETLGCHINTINNTLKELEAKKAIRRDTQQINKFKKERKIHTSFISNEHKNCVTEAQKLCSHEHKNCAGDEHKNCASLDNTLLDKRIDKKAVLEKLPHLPPEILDLTEKKPTMKEQLKDAKIVIDEKGNKRVQLTNGKLQDQTFKNIFLTTQERAKIRDRFNQEFSEEWKFYFIHAFKVFDDWLDDNKAKGLALKSHYKTILKWPLAEAKKARLDDLRTFNAESQKERYAR